ncbi:LGFP repeat-containing protein [Amnibacterium flavum]|nr:hypothetical protein [Amnibacterium flavum]
MSTIAAGVLYGGTDSRASKGSPRARPTLAESGDRRRRCTGSILLVHRGETGAAYARNGSETGALGWPTNQQRCGLPRNGCYQDFEGGSIHWSPAGGAHATSGAIRSYWAAQGWENSSLGYPTGDAVTIADGTQQQFQGQTVYALASGAVRTVDRGETGAAYGRAGSQTGVLGWPANQQRCGLLRNGCY